MSDLTYKSQRKMIKILGQETDTNESDLDQVENELNHDYWDDMAVSSVASRLGSNDKPDFDYTNIGFLFPESTSEILYVSTQLTHRYVEGTNVIPHIHWIQTDGDNPANWYMQYKWYNVGGEEPSFTEINTAESVELTFTGTRMHQISSFGEIDGTGKGISSLFEAKIWRNNDDLVGDALFKSFDLHLQVNQWGSYLEYIKENPNG